MLKHQSRHHLAQRRTMLEAVAGASAQQPNIFVPGMAIDDEIVVRAVLILADARLQQRRIFQRGKAEGDIVSADLSPSALTVRSPDVGSNSGPRVSSAILKPLP